VTTLPGEEPDHPAADLLIRLIGLCPELEDHADAAFDLLAEALDGALAEGAGQVLEAHAEARALAELDRLELEALGPSDVEPGP